MAWVNLGGTVATAGAGVGQAYVRKDMATSTIEAEKHGINARRWQKLSEVAKADRKDFQEIISLLMEAFQNFLNALGKMQSGQEIAATAVLNASG